MRGVVARSKSVSGERAWRVCCLGGPASGILEKGEGAWCCRVGRSITQEYWTKAADNPGKKSTISSNFLCAPRQAVL